jgi:hypothetical protein
MPNRAYLQERKAMVVYFSVSLAGASLVEDGGVSHVNYLRYNLLLTGMHLRLFAGFIIRLPLLIWRK